MNFIFISRSILEEERNQARSREDDYHNKIDALDKEIFTLTECVEVSESHAEDLQSELMKERARTGFFYSLQS
jgi:hypothetical protein